MKRKHSIIPRVLISLLGIGMIFMGCSGILLGYIGEQATGLITSIRREGGERTDGVPGRYTYNIAYEFALPDGKVISGFTKKVNSAVYLKPDGTTKTKIRYIAKFPYINVMEVDAGLQGGHMVMIAAGVTLIYLMNRKPSL